MADSPTPLGRHLLLDLYDCPEALLRFPADSETILLAAAAAMGATVIESRFHAFSPHGVSGMVIIAESHLSIHTWPQHGYAAVDVFSCGELDLEAGLAILEKSFKAGRKEAREFKRGKER
jgi:S-adenosylmethionine decarboxylase proenzyme